MTQKIIRRREVQTKTGKSRSSMYADISRGNFPKPIKIGSRAVGWLESDVDAWIESRVAESRTPAASI